MEKSKSGTDSFTAATDTDITESSSVSITSWEAQDTVQPHVGYKKVLVTGGAGFIGSNVAEYLLERGDDVEIVDEFNDYYDVHIKEANIRILTNRYGPDRLSIYKCDICDEERMTNIFEDERPK